MTPPSRSACVVINSHIRPWLSVPGVHMLHSNVKPVHAVGGSLPLTLSAEYSSSIVSISLQPRLRCHTPFLVLRAWDHS